MSKWPQPISYPAATASEIHILEDKIIRLSSLPSLKDTLLHLSNSFHQLSMWQPAAVSSPSSLHQHHFIFTLWDIYSCKINLQAGEEDTNPLITEQDSLESKHYPQESKERKRVGSLLTICVREETSFSKLAVHTLIVTYLNTHTVKTASTLASPTSVPPFVKFILIWKPSEVWSRQTGVWGQEDWGEPASEENSGPDMTVFWHK